MGNVGYVEFLQHYLYCEGYNWGKELILCPYGNVKPSQVFPKFLWELLPKKRFLLGHHLVWGVVQKNNEMSKLSQCKNWHICFNLFFASLIMKIIEKKTMKGILCEWGFITFCHIMSGTLEPPIHKKIILANFV